MVRIIDKINEHAKHSKTPFFSFEFFPPKTEEGRENLYIRMDRMSSLEPIFIDITWGAGGSTKDLSLMISKYSQTYFGAEVMMHLTCSGLTRAELKACLDVAKEAGIQNILALRGDPPRGAVTWEPTPGGCLNAAELVSLIKSEYGDYFGIAVAGFPEGYPSQLGEIDLDLDVKYLKAKVDAGADFVLTQFFYDSSVFINFVARCRAGGISCPILPGMMPIQSFSSFQRMASLCGTSVPDSIWESLSTIKADDEAVKSFGVSLCHKMCLELIEAGIPGFHFYTLNLERSVLAVLKELGIRDSTASRRALPWRASRSNLQGKEEDVRPINWANRPKSYISRTLTWDDFPNGRWGDSRSPAFGDLTAVHLLRPAAGSKADRLAMWGEAPVSPQDVFNVFSAYVEGKVPILPWCETALQDETGMISLELVEANRCGMLTINSQPAVNGEKSDHKVFGWGGDKGRVYQKAYLEFFCSPELLDVILALISPDSLLTCHAINHEGVVRKSKETVTDSAHGHSSATTALTWGVFPDKEIKQPTVFDESAFEVWSKEAFQLWVSAWASLYDDESESAALLYDMHDSYYLVAIVDNDYIEPSLFTFVGQLIEARTVRNGTSSPRDGVSSPPEF
jgi:methylenetetrahydrofolate reductase (NADPH)